MFILSGAIQTLTHSHFSHILSENTLTLSLPPTCVCACHVCIGVNLPQSFLAPFGLNLYADSTVAAAGTPGEHSIKRAKEVAKNVLVACSDKDR